MFFFSPLSHYLRLVLGVWDNCQIHSVISSSDQYLKCASCIRLASLLSLLLVRKFIKADMKSEQLLANSDTIKPNKGNTYELRFPTKKSIAYKLKEILTSKLGT